VDPAPRLLAAELRQPELHRERHRVVERQRPQVGAGVDGRRAGFGSEVGHASGYHARARTPTAVRRPAAYLIVTTSVVSSLSFTPLVAASAGAATAWMQALAASVTGSITSL
jgi:hypothetical protein